MEDLTADIMLEVIEEQAAQGVDYMTIHAGVLIQYLPLHYEAYYGHCQSRRRHIWRSGWPIIISRTFSTNDFDDITKVLAKYDVAYSLGDGLRPGLPRRRQ